jgi:hypothetical protein
MAGGLFGQDHRYQAEGGKQRLDITIRVCAKPVTTASRGPRLRLPTKTISRDNISIPKTATSIDDQVAIKKRYLVHPGISAPVQGKGPGIEKAKWKGWSTENNRQVDHSIRSTQQDRAAMMVDGIISIYLTGRCRSF